MSGIDVFFLIFEPICYMGPFILFIVLMIAIGKASEKKDE